MDKFRKKIANAPRWIMIGFLPELTAVILKTYVTDWVKSKLFIDWGGHGRLQ
jgi:hypothetical protein